MTYQRVTPLPGYKRYSVKRTQQYTVSRKGMGGHRPDPLHLRLARNMRIDAETGCWLWTRSLDELGYAHTRNDISVVRAGGKTTIMAHRAMYEVVVGPIPDGLELDHLCRVRHCINPRHLEPVTHRENVLRGTSPNAVTLRRGVCHRGHDRADPAKLGSGRTCLPCSRITASRRRKLNRLNAEIQHLTELVAAVDRLPIHSSSQPADLLSLMSEPPPGLGGA